MINGKRISKTFATKADAEEYRLEVASSAARGIRIDADAFGLVVDAWLDHVKATKDDNTWQSYQYAVEPFTHLRNVGLDRVSTLALQNVIDSLSGRKAQLAHDKLRQCIRWAIRKQVIRHDMTAGLDRPKHERQPIEPFMTEEVRQLLTESEHMRYHAAIRIALLCGLRGGEVWGLQWSDLDGHDLSIQRQASETSGVITIKPPKRNSARTIALPDSVVDALAAIERPTIKPDGWIFPGPNGGNTRRSNFSQRVWKALLKTCDIRARGFHHCRHTAATLMLNSGVPITVVASILGHKDAATTLSIYAHLITSDRVKHRNWFERIG